MERKLLSEIAEELVSLTSGSSDMLPMKVSRQETERDVDGLREVALQTMFSPIAINPSNKPALLNSVFTQSPILIPNTTQPSFLDLDFCYYTYPCEPVVTLNTNMDGFLSVRGVTETSSPQAAFKFYKCQSMEQWQNIIQRGTRNNDTRVYWVYCDNELRISKRISAVKVRAVFLSPTKISSYNINTKAYEYMYNPDVDPYPVTGACLDIMRSIWWAKKGQIYNSEYKDMTDNGELDQQRLTTR